MTELLSLIGSSKSVGKAYRYVGVASTRGGTDDEGWHHYGSPADVVLVEYNIIRHTPKGFWVDRCEFGRPRFVLNDSRKKFAHPTKAKALDSFIARKNKHIRILEKQLADCKVQLNLATNATKETE